MKKIFTLVALSALILPAFAQQDKQITHYFFNNITTNPGAAGVNENICVGMTLRNQWVGFPGNPQTGIFTFSSPLAPKFGGVGLVLIADQLGASKDFTFKASYAYQFKLGANKDKVVSVGLNAGFLNRGIDFSLFNTASGPTYTQLLDPYLMGATGTQSVLKPDLGGGVFYDSRNITFGLSAQQLLAGSDKFGKLTYASGAESHIRRHYYMTGGYKYKPGNGDWLFKPSFLLKSDGVATQFDFNILAEWRETIWGGATYRYQDAATVMIGFYPTLERGNVNKTLRIGYAYDFTTSGMGEPSQGGSTGSHEIYIGYCLKKPVPPRVTYFDPTWL